MTLLLSLLLFIFWFWLPSILHPTEEQTPSPLQIHPFSLSSLLWHSSHAHTHPCTLTHTHAHSLTHMLARTHTHSFQVKLINVFYVREVEKSCRLSKSSVCIDKQAVMNFKRINDSKVIFFFTLCSHADEMNGLMEHQHCPEKTSESGAVIRTRNSSKAVQMLTCVHAG